MNSRDRKQQKEKMPREVTKQDFERFIVNFNEIVSCLETDPYSSKQHLIDRWDKFCDAWIRGYDLNIENYNQRHKER